MGYSRLLWVLGVRDMRNATKCARVSPRNTDIFLKIIDLKNVCVCIALTFACQLNNILPYNGSSLCPVCWQLKNLCKLIEIELCVLQGDGNLSVITEHHISGTKLPVIRLAVVDTYDQVVSAGVSDSGMYCARYAEKPNGMAASIAFYPLTN